MRLSSSSVFFSICQSRGATSVDTSFLTSEKKSYDQSAGFSSAKRLILSRYFLAGKSRYVYNNVFYIEMELQSNRSTAILMGNPLLVYNTALKVC